jgi:hypothetical protein
MPQQQAPLLEVRVLGENRKPLRPGQVPHLLIDRSVANSSTPDLPAEPWSLTPRPWPPVHPASRAGSGLTPQYAEWV